jgi:hypothetical protein
MLEMIAFKVETGSFGSRLSSSAKLKEHMDLSEENHLF